MGGKRKPAPFGASNQNRINYSMVSRLIQILGGLTEPATREYLSSALGISDRAVRALVQSARMEGHPICSRSDCKGYWLGNHNDRMRLSAEYRSRANADLAVARALESHLADGSEQMSIGGLL